MSDRYLYRAKTKLIVGTYNCGKEDGEWVKGYLYCDTGRWMIKQFEYDRANYIDYEVDPSTICQCTGKNDVDGKLIFEHDIVAFLDAFSTENGWSEHNCIGEVCWDDETLSFQVTESLSAESYEVLEECKVIGNIFDNPEL